jgi:hypothetical protein
VEGASDSTLRCRCRKIESVAAFISLERYRCVAARAPPTILRSLRELRMVPPPR